MLDRCRRHDVQTLALCPYCLGLFTHEVIPRPILHQDGGCQRKRVGREGDLLDLVEWQVLTTD